MTVVRKQQLGWCRGIHIPQYCHTQDGLTPHRYQHNSYCNPSPYPTNLACRIQTRAPVQQQPHYLYVTLLGCHKQGRRAILRVIS